MSVPRELRATAERFRTGPERATRAAGKLYKDELEKRLRHDAGGDFSLSGVRRKKMGVTARYEGGSSLASVTLTASKGGVAQYNWLESGTNSHMVGRGAKDMRVSGQWRTGPWRVNGMRAKRTWSEPVEDTTPQAIKTIEDSFLNG